MLAFDWFILFVARAEEMGRRTSLMDRLAPTPIRVPSAQDVASVSEQYAKPDSYGMFLIVLLTLLLKPVLVNS